MNADQKQRAQSLLDQWREASDWNESVSALLRELIDAPEVEPVATVTGYYGGHLSISTIDGRVLPAGTALYLAQPAQSVPDVNWLAGIIQAIDDKATYPVPARILAEKICAAMLAEQPQPAPQPALSAPESQIALNEWLDKTEWVQKAIGTFPIPSLGMHRADVMRLEIARLRKVQPEPPADLVRDAERLDWLLRKLPGDAIRYCVGELSDTSDEKEFRDAIDAAIERQGGE